jgi:hypothetical protein
MKDAQIICLSFLFNKLNYLIWTPCLYLLCPQVDHLDDRQRMAMGDKLVMHSRGPMVSAVKYNRYVVNEKLFRTIVHDVGKRSQNSGVCVPTVDGETYYGKLTQIIEVEYYDRTKYVLFKCDWADNTRDKGWKMDKHDLMLVNFKNLHRPVNEPSRVELWQTRLGSFKNANKRAELEPELSFKPLAQARLDEYFDKLRIELGIVKGKFSSRVEPSIDSTRLELEQGKIMN